MSPRFCFMKQSTILNGNLKPEQTSTTSWTMMASTTDSNSQEPIFSNSQEPTSTRHRATKERSKVINHNLLTTMHAVCRIESKL